MVYLSAGWSDGSVTDPTKGISVSCAEHAVFVRVVGRGTFQNGQPLRRYSVERIEQGCGEFFVDLAKCDGMDSTFLGVLAGIGLRLQQNGRAGKLHVINVSARNMEDTKSLVSGKSVDLGGW